MQPYNDWAEQNERLASIAYVFDQLENQYGPLDKFLRELYTFIEANIGKTKEEFRLELQIFLYQFSWLEDEYLADEAFDDVYRFVLLLKIQRYQDHNDLSIHHYIEYLNQRLGQPILDCLPPDQVNLLNGRCDELIANLDQIDSQLIPYLIIFAITFVICVAMIATGYFYLTDLLPGLLGALIARYGNIRSKRLTQQAIIASLEAPQGLEQKEKGQSKAKPEDIAGRTNSMENEDNTEPVDLGRLIQGESDLFLEQ